MRGRLLPVDDIYETTRRWQPASIHKILVPNAKVNWFWLGKTSRGAKVKQILKRRPTSRGPNKTRRALLFAAAVCVRSFDNS